MIRYLMNLQKDSQQLYQEEIIMIKMSLESLFIQFQGKESILEVLKLLSLFKQLQLLLVSWLPRTLLERRIFQLDQSLLERCTMICLCSMIKFLIILWSIQVILWVLLVFMMDFELIESLRITQEYWVRWSLEEELGSTMKCAWQSLLIVIKTIA